MIGDHEGQLVQHRTLLGRCHSFQCHLEVVHLGETDAIVPGYPIADARLSDAARSTQQEYLPGALCVHTTDYYLHMNQLMTMLDSKSRYSMLPKMSGDTKSAPGVATVANTKQPKNATSRLDASHRDEVLPTADSDTRTSGNSNESPNTTRINATKPT